MYKSCGGKHALARTVIVVIGGKELPEQAMLLYFLRSCHKDWVPSFKPGAELIALLVSSISKTLNQFPVYFAW